MKIMIITDAWEPNINGVVRMYKSISEIIASDGHEVKIVEPSTFLFHTSAENIKKSLTS